MPCGPASARGGFGCVALAGASQLRERRKRRPRSWGGTMRERRKRRPRSWGRTMRERRKRRPRKNHQAVTREKLWENELFRKNDTASWTGEISEKTNFLLKKYTATYSAFGRPFKASAPTALTRLSLC